MASPLPIDPYETLGVARDADLGTIRAAHRKLALKHHPDRIKDETLRKKGTEEFQKAQQAYELLADEKRRARYDDQCRLAQLKKETMMDRSVPLKTSSYSTPRTGEAPRTASSTTYEFGRVYEERRPARYSDEDDRYAEPPRSNRKHVYERRPATSYPEEKKKKHSEKSSSMFGSFVDSKLREKAREAKDRAARAEAAKARDRERRRESTDKYRRRAYVEDDLSSDSDTYVPRRPEPPPRRRTYYEEPPRRRQESPPRRRETRRPVTDSSSSESEDDSYHDEWARRHNDAKHYISERSAGRPSILRTDSAKYYSAPRERSAGRKSGSDKDERREERPKTSKTSKPEVVDPPRRSPQSRKPPPMASAKSSPTFLKGMAREARDAPQRSATGDYSSEPKRPIPTMNRSNTMPIPTTFRKEQPPSRSSKLKHTETHDSGYGSSGQNTPEVHSGSPPKTAKTTTSKFFIVEEDPEHVRGSYRTVPVGENYASRRTRSPSPLHRDRDRERDRDRDKDKERKRSERPDRPERPTVQTTASYSTSRSTPYTVSPERLSSRPQAFRTDSSRSAVPRESTTSRGDPGGRRGEGYSFKPENVRYSPALSPDNLNKYARRQASELRDRDFWPGSDHHENIHAPKTGRRESIY